jgi:conjugative transfer signal peptidase TraF
MKTSPTVLACAGIAGLAAMTLAAPAPKLVLVNESPSLPRGLYARVLRGEVVRGAIVAIPQPTVARPYLASLGFPGQVRLIKRVGAASGDQVCASPGALSLSGRILVVRDHDRFGAVLPVWRGCRRLGTDELFLLGDTANSFDSRYFGPVPRAQVEGVFREVAAW